MMAQHYSSSGGCSELHFSLYLFSFPQHVSYVTNGVFLLNIYIHILRVHVYMSCSYVCTDDHDDYPPKISITDKVHKIRLFVF